jgi:hypothetical protein
MCGGGHRKVAYDGKTLALVLGEVASSFHGSAVSKKQQNGVAEHFSSLTWPGISLGGVRSA